MNTPNLHKSQSQDQHPVSGTRERTSAGQSSDSGANDYRIE